MEAKNIMKKFICIVLTFIIIIGSFSACNYSDEISNTNIKEKFLPTLKASCYELGSAFYEIELDSHGDPVQYNIDGYDAIFFKITTEISPNQIIENIKKYVDITSELEYKLRILIIEFESSTYVDALSSYGGYESIFDINSINLQKTENGKYYVSVDEYAYPDSAGSEEFLDYNMSEPIYHQTVIYTTVLEDGILKIVDAQSEKSNPKNDIKDYDFIGSFDRLAMTSK